MLGKMGMAGLFMLAAVAPAMAADCNEPIPPTMLDGSKATEQQMRDAISDFKTFQAASDDYQSCMLADLKQQQEAAAKAKDPKPLDPAIQSGIQAKINANQSEKEKLGGELNAQIIAYKQSHPKG